MTEGTYYKMEITKRECFYMAYFWLDATIMDLKRLMDAIALLKSKDDDGRMKEQIEKVWAASVETYEQCKVMAKEFGNMSDGLREGSDDEGA